MFSAHDTIVAIATPPGRGGIGVVRISGAEAVLVARRLIAHTKPLEARYATLTTIRAIDPPTFESAAHPPGLNARFSATGSAVSALTPTSGDARAISAPSTTTFAPCPAEATAGGASRAGAFDQVVATYFPGPHSYTGDDVVELSAHGSPIVLRTIVSAAVAAGARLAEPGEFTLRAFLNGRMDLMQAEAVADLIESVTPLQARAAFDQLQGTLTRTIGEIDEALFDLIARLEASVDFPEEGYHFVDPSAVAGAIDGLRVRTTALLAAARRGRLVREGFQVAIVGKPNVGKSSLFNALAGASRAIVTDVPGTTRDLVSEVVDLDGFRVTLVDTAGQREADDAIEAEGVKRSREAQRVADVTLIVLDRAAPLDDADRAIIAATVGRPRVIVANKADREACWTEEAIGDASERALTASAVTSEGLDELRARLVAALDVDVRQDRPEITNVRHITLVERADEALARASRAALADGGSLSEEFVLADLQDARAALEEVAGRRVPDDLLAHIFSRFCIGK